MTISEFIDESETRKVFQLEVPVEKTDAIETEIARAYGRQVHVPGFRKGKVPLRVARKKFRNEIREEVLRRVVEETTMAAISDRELLPVAAPQVSDVHFQEGEPIRFKATVDVQPQFELGEYRGLEMPFIETVAKDEEVDNALKRVADRHAEFVPVEDRTAARGDFLIINVHGVFPEDEDTDDFNDEGVMVELGHEDNLEEINELLQGKGPGEKVTFQREWGEDTPMAGRTVDYEVELIEIKEKELPPIDDALALTASMGESLEEMRSNLSLQIGAEKARVLKQAQENAVLGRLVQAHQFEVPESLVEAEIDRGLRRVMTDYVKRGHDISGIDWKELREGHRDESRQRVAAGMLLDRIATKEKVEITDTELQAEIRSMARSTNQEPADLRQHLVENHQIEQLRSDLVREAVVKMLIEWATPVESSDEEEGTE